MIGLLIGRDASCVRQDWICTTDGDAVSVPFHWLVQHPASLPTYFH